MANIRNYSRTVLTKANILTYDIRYNGQIVDDVGTVLGDFTAGTTLLTVLNTLTAAQGLEFADLCSLWLLKTKFPGVIG